MCVILFLELKFVILASSTIQTNPKLLPGISFFKYHRFSFSSSSSSSNSYLVLLIWNRKLSQADKSFMGIKLSIDFEIKFYFYQIGIQ